jgi:PAS domain S-box-containing protein
MTSKAPRIISIILVFLILIITIVTVYSISMQTRTAMKEAVQEKLMSVAAIAATQIDGDSFALLGRGDEGSPAFLKIRDALKKMQQASPDIHYMYTMRMNGSNIEFVVDGDYGHAGDAAVIGEIYRNANRELILGFTRPSADSDFNTDKWGTVLSGYSPIRDRAGNIVGLVGVDMDSSVVLARLNFLNMIYYLIGIIAIAFAAIAIFIIERRRAIEEAKVEASETYLNQIYTSVNAGIIIIDSATFEILDANPTACGLIGLRKEQIIGQGYHRFFISVSAGQSRQTDELIKISGSEGELITGAGTRISIIEHVVPVTLNGRACLLETFIDNRDRKSATTDLIALNRKLQILSTVTRNDILSELFGLAGYLEILRDEKPELKDNPILSKLGWVMDRLQVKTMFFRDFEEAGTKGPVWMDLSIIVEKAWQSSAMSHITIFSDLKGISVYADPMIEKVFFRLFDNTRRHGVHATEVRLSSQETVNGLRIICEDNGTGIPEKDKERIFNRGFGSYTGLGLFFAREVLGITGLTIRETGLPGTGARFEILVPEGKYRITRNT